MSTQGTGEGFDHIETRQVRRSHKWEKEGKTVKTPIPNGSEPVFLADGEYVEAA